MKPLKVTLLEIDDRELPAFSVDKQKGYAGYVVLFRYGYSIDKEGKIRLGNNGKPVPKQVKLTLKDELGIRITDGEKARKAAKEAVRTYVRQAKSDKLNRDIESSEQLKQRMFELSMNPVRDLIGEFISHFYGPSSDKSPATIDHAKRNMRYLIDSPKCPSFLELIDKQTFESIHDEVKGRKGPDRDQWRSWNQILVYWYKFFDWLMDEGKLKEKVWRSRPFIKAPKDFVASVELWSLEELDQICDEAVKHGHPEDATYFKMTRYTSIYPADIFTLKRRHFSQVNDKENPGRKVWRLNKVRQKSATGNEIYIQDIRDPKVLDFLLPRLKSIEEPEERIFEKELSVFKDFKSLLSSLNPRLKIYWKRIGKKPKSIKALRHTFITREVEKGTKIHLLRQMVGHRQGSRILERVYLHLGQDID